MDPYKFFMGLGLMIATTSSLYAVSLTEPSSVVYAAYATILAYIAGFVMHALISD